MCVTNREEKNGAVSSYGRVLQSCSVDRLFRNLSCRLFRDYLIRKSLGWTKYTNRCFILENISFCCRQNFQNFVFDLLQFPTKQSRWRRLKKCNKTLMYFLLAAPWTISWFFSDSKSGLSLATTIPRSWSSRPIGVIMKFSSVTLTATSGK